MFANRFTAFTDACVLVAPLKRNMLLTLAAADFFRIRWSAAVLDETERAICRIRKCRGFSSAAADAGKARRAMEEAFEEASVAGFDARLSEWPGLPDPGDAHVIAAAAHTRADVIVTDNLRHFPPQILAPLGIEARSADAFLADTIDLDQATAVHALAEMRTRLKRPEMTADDLLVRMEAEGLTATVDVLRSHVSLM
jgi:hypothetical protein